MKLRRYRGILLGLAALVCSCVGPATDRQPQSALVIGIIDGDTIELEDGRVVRYMCIDTPERDQPFYEEATQLNIDLVYGKTVTLFPGRRALDHYGRTLARVVVDEIFVAESLVSAGLAVVYGFEDNEEYLGPLIARQKEAIDAGRGIWTLLLAGDDDEEFYVGSTIGFRFHRPGCSAAAGIRADHVKHYSSRREAYYLGMSPCRNCRP